MTANTFVLLPNRLPTKVGVVPLVKEELGADSLHDDVPGVHGARAAHQRGEDGVCGEHVPLGFRQLQRGRGRKRGGYSQI